jgi:hypothetical protein
MQPVWQLSLRIPDVYLCSLPRGPRSRCALPTWYRIGGVEALIRVHFDLVSDDRGRNGFADASLPSNTSSASVEGLAVNFKSALLVHGDTSGPRKEGQIPIRRLHRTWPGSIRSDDPLGQPE